MNGGASGRLLLPHHRTMLEVDSAIAADVIAERGYFRVETRKELKAAFGSDTYTDHLPGLVIPVYNVLGELAFNHVRFDDPPIRDGKARKYLLPYRAHGAVDVPRRVRPLLGDPAVPLWCTEGSRKVDSLLSAGVNAIGLTGVWNWRGTNEHGGKTLLADFETIAFNDGREIHIVFDSDVMWKDGVRLALERFRAVAKRRGGDVLLHYLPAELPA